MEEIGFAFSLYRPVEGRFKPAMSLLRRESSAAPARSTEAVN
jgi:hypothetical protein